MKTPLNRNRRRKLKRARDEAKRRARHLGLEEIPHWDRLKTTNWDRRPNTMVPSTGEKRGGNHRTKKRQQRKVYS